MNDIKSNSDNRAYNRNVLAKWKVYDRVEVRDTATDIVEFGVVTQYGTNSTGEIVIGLTMIVEINRSIPDVKFFHPYTTKYILEKC